jgi:hypothetical protein
MDIKEICINTRNWVDSAQDRDYWRILVNAALNLRVPQVMELDSNNLGIQCQRNDAMKQGDTYLFQ